MFELELVCPVCLHDAGVVTCEMQLQATCPGCQIVLGVLDSGATKMLAPIGQPFEPPQRQLSRRVAPPKSTKVRLKRNGDTLRACVRFGVITPFLKRIELSPTGYELRTWRKRGTQMPLGDIIGVIAMQLYLGMMPGTFGDRAQLVWISTLVFHRDGGVMYQPLFVHSREDAAYFASVLNAHLAELKTAAAHPYRGA